MSFKREGDDSSLLRNLQHRRVADLIGDYIPDEEATLLSNGRLTCLVCARRPIFDTIPMLSVHRKGKKHMIELSKHLSHKRELERRKLKRDQELSLQPEPLPNERLLEPATLGKRLLTSAVPYSSCTKHTKKNSFQGWNRKTILDVERSKDIKTDLVKAEDSLPSTSSEVRKYLKELWKKKALKKTVEESRMNYNFKNSTSLAQERLSVDKMHLSEPSSTTTSKQLTESRLVSELTGHTSVSSTSKQCFNINQQAQNEINLRMSGWITDKGGRWVKDPEAEFDSDVETPPTPTSYR